MHDLQLDHARETAPVLIQTNVPRSAYCGIRNTPSDVILPEEDILPGEFYIQIGSQASVARRDLLIPTIGYTVEDNGYGNCQQRAIFLGMVYPSGCECNVHHIFPHFFFKQHDPEHDGADSEQARLVMQAFEPLAHLTDFLGDDYFLIFGNPESCLNKVKIPMSFHTGVHQYPYEQYEAAIRAVQHERDVFRHEALTILMQRNFIMWDPYAAQYMRAVSILNTELYVTRSVCKTRTQVNYIAQTLLAANGSSGMTSEQKHTKIRTLQVSFRRLQELHAHIAMLGDFVREFHPEMYRVWAESMERGGEVEM